MDFHFPKLDSATLRRLGIVFLVLSATWLFAPSLTHILRPGPNLISEYESNTVMYGALFRLGDVLAALVLVGTAFITAATMAARWGRYVPRVVAFLALLMTVDALVPVRCLVVDGICTTVNDGMTIVHGVESFGLAATVFGLSLYLAWRYRYGYWFLVVQALSLLAGFAATRLGGDHWLFSIQAGYQLMQAYWLFGIVFDSPRLSTDMPLTSVRTPAAARIVRNTIAIWVAANGLLALILSSHHIVFGRIAQPLVFAGNTPWLLGHTMLVGILLLYIARQLWQGDRRAMVLAMALLLSEVLHASLSHRGWFLVPMFGLPLLALIYYRSIFDRRGGFLGFTSRLRFIVVGVAALAVVVTLTTIAFRLEDHRAWDRSPYDVGRVVRRVALLEVSADNRDSPRTVMFDHLLTLLGSSIYIWLILGIFVPRSSFATRKDSLSCQDMAQALGSGSSSSEDYFKLWPITGKRYFKTHSGALIAYTIANGLVVALADPVIPKHLKKSNRQAIMQFLAYCRSNGYKSIWLVVGSASKLDYESAGYNCVQIGSSARIDIKTFCEKTARNKWWRWQLNRAKRSDYRYEVSAVGEHTAELLQQTRQVSDAWLSRPGHREQSFAMGYYDNNYLNSCRLHCLFDASGQMIAFANELPVYNDNPQSTVDLIRFLPDIDGAMPVLLARCLQQLHDEGRFTLFDLGLVPLAKVDNRVAKLIKQFASSRFSAHGLAQFKNKFDPDWQPGYLAYDGDGLDLAKALVSLNKAMEYNDSTQTDAPDAGKP